MGAFVIVINLVLRTMVLYGMKISLWPLWDSVRRDAAGLKYLWESQSKENRILMTLFWLSLLCMCGVALFLAFQEGENK